MKDSERLKRESARAMEAVSDAAEKIRDAIDNPEKPWIDIAKCVSAFHNQLKKEGFNDSASFELTKSLVSGLGGAAVRG